MKNDTDKLLTVKVAAERLGIGEGAVRVACNRGTLKGQLASDLLPVKVRTWLISPEAVEEFRKRTQPNGVKKAGRPRVRPEKGPQTDANNT